jgi:nucleoside-diphosphate-sugar epimerase
MNILITGGAGFLGQRLVAELLLRGELRGGGLALSPITSITVLDAFVDGITLTDRRVRVIRGDIGDPGVLASVLDQATASIFHLAAVVSGAAEADFDLGMRVNFDATRMLFERCRALAHRPRVVMASSVAAFASAGAGAIVCETTAPAPLSSYGTQKVLAELLLNDYTRKGFIDGIALRVPTVCVRPGKPNAAASGFASSIIREPLAGRQAVCPVPAETLMWLMSPKLAIDNLIHAHEMAGHAIGYPRTVTLPGLSITVGAMALALRAVAGDEIAELIRWSPNEAIGRIVQSWPGTIDTPRARALGFRADARFEDVIDQYRDSLGA